VASNSGTRAPPEAERFEPLKAFPVRLDAAYSEDMAADKSGVVHRWWAHFNEHGPYHGHEGVRQYVEDIFEVTDEVRVELDEIIDAGDGETLVTVQRARGRARYTRLDTDFPWAAIWTIRRGRVVRAQGYATKAEALSALKRGPPGAVGLPNDVRRRGG
jgi:ketosteroid isomerase-like protein